MTFRTTAALIVGIPLLLVVGLLLTYWSFRRYDTTAIVRELPHAPSTPVTSSESDLKIATFNLYFSPADRKARFEIAAQTLAALSPDILFLQEVATGGIHNDDPIQYLGSQLGLPYTTYFPVENLLLFKQGLAILSRYPIESSTARVFEKNQPIETKGYLAASIRTPHGLIHTIDVHLMNAPGARFGKDTQFHALESALQDLRKSGPVIVAGDFNAEPGDSELESFLARSQARNLYQSFPPQGETRFTWGNELLLDYILVFDSTGKPAHPAYQFKSGNIVKTQEVNGLLASDHLPVSAVLNVPST